MGHWEFEQHVNGLAWFYREDKMKVIDLLNKIANGEDIPLIRFNHRTLKYDYEGSSFEDVFNDDGYCKVDVAFEDLNDELELLGEEKKIEKLKLNDSDVWTGKTDTNLIVEKINEVIDYINKENK